jgi:hypothetical protein
VQQNLINARIEKLKAEGKDQTVIDAYKQRAQKAYDLYMAKKTGEVYDVTKKEINTIWEEKKGVANKFAEKAGEYIFHKPLLRHTIGNKWFRFATISAAYVASGASLAFVANRAVRFVGGNIIGASAVKMVLNKLYNEEKMLREGMSILEELYSKNRTDQETNADKIWLEESYINNRRRIEIELNSIKRLKETIIISAGLTTGMIASDLDQQFHISDTVGEKIQNISETTTVTDGNTQIEMNNTVQQKSFADTLREGSKPTVDSTDPAQQGGMNDTAKAAAQEGTSPETQTTAPTEAPEKHAIVEAGSGKGFEHSFRAQIEHNKVLAAKLKELYHYEGDISSTEGLHKFSGIAAHKMALAEGYVSTDGSERFIHGTVAPEIEIEGNEVVIHERVLNNGKWIDMDTADRASGHFETGVDRDPSGNIYEKTHMGSHTNIDHPHSQLKTHVEHLRESIVKAYTEEPEYLIEDKPKIDLHTTLEKPSAVDLPPPTKNVIDLPPPTKTVIDLPPPTVTPQPTVPVQNVQPSFVPPSTRPDPMYNQRFQMGYTWASNIT